MDLGRVHAFIIHLERAEGRRQQADTLLRLLPVPAEIVPAVDGLTLGADEIKAVYRRRLHRPNYPFALLKTEIACFLSHRKAWQLIVERDLDGAIIVEDDVKPIEERFDRVVAFALRHMQPADYIRFPRRHRTDVGPVVARGDEMRLMQPSYVGQGTHMQLVGREAARMLLDATATFDRPVDTTIQMRWLSSARVLAARPTCIVEFAHALGGTVIQQRSSSVGETLYREWNRFAYRAAVRVASLLAGR
jgi:GR25 family glycosyltransferase involved in LPS biosynthesis